MVENCSTAPWQRHVPPFSFGHCRPGELPLGAEAGRGQQQLQQHRGSCPFFSAAVEPNEIDALAKHRNGHSSIKAAEIQAVAIR
jgi:hypothetical protein